MSDSLNDWKNAKLGDLCIIEMGQSPPGSSYNDIGNGTPLINGPVEFGPTAFSRTIKSKFTTEPNKLCKQGDLILCVRGSTTGRMNIADFDAAIGRGVAAIRSRTADIDQGFINHFINSKRQNIYDLGTGSTFPNISKGVIGDIEVPVPSLPEQRRIVAKIEELFSRLDAGVAALKKAKAQLKRYRQSVLAAAVTGELTKEWRAQNPDTEQLDLFGLPLPHGWKCPSFQEVISEGPRNGFSPKCGKSVSGSKVLKLSATSSCQMLLNDQTTKTSLSPVAPTSHAWLEPNDVLIQRANSLELLGSTAIYEGPANEYVYPDLMMRVRVAEQVTRKLLAIYLNSLPARNYFQRKATGVAGNMPKINGATLKALPVPLPPFAEQQQIINEVEVRTTAFDHLEVELDKQLLRANKLRQSILSDAFTGNL
ncbi:MAG: hypothetical protein F6K19_47820 [Cyanothece sp. SIO1E1]|nr:hypothetical protein [Cyanothece sp. SIO1E1]